MKLNCSFFFFLSHSFHLHSPSSPWNSTFHLRRTPWPVSIQIHFITTMVARWSKLTVTSVLRLDRSWMMEVGTIWSSFLTKLNSKLLDINVGVVIYLFWTILCSILIFLTLIMSYFKSWFDNHAFVNLD